MILEFLLSRLLCGAPENARGILGCTCGRREHSELCDRQTMSKIPIKKQKHIKMLNYKL